MAYVIDERCLGEQYAQCVEVCPVDCIYAGDHNGEPFMVIDPEICITCGACVPVCPVGAVLESEELNAEYAKLNAELSPQWKDNPKVTPRPSDEPPRKPHHKLVI